MLPGFRTVGARGSTGGAASLEGAAALEGAAERCGNGAGTRGGKSGFRGLFGASLDMVLKRSPCRFERVRTVTMCEGGMRGPELYGSSGDGNCGEVGGTRCKIPPPPELADRHGVKRN